MKEAKVYLVGGGPGDVGLLTLRGRTLLEQADVIVYDALVNEALLSFAKPGVEKIFVGKRRGWHELSQQEISALLVERARQGLRVVRLKGGDPFLFGRGGEEASVLAEAGVSFEIVPGVSSALAVPAYAGIPVTHRDFCRVLTICTGHSAVQGAAPLDFSVLAKTQGTLVFLMSVRFLSQNVSGLLSNGMSPDTPAAVIEWGTLPSQRVVSSTLSMIVQKATEEKIGAPSILVIGEVVSLRERLSWFLPPPLAGKRVLVTRAKEQAEELCQKLQEVGATPVLLPAIELHPLPLVKDEFTGLSQFQWVIFTSANSVRFYLDALFSSGKDARALGGAKIAAVGQKTEEALLQRGLRADFVPPEARSEVLAQTLPIVEGERVKFVRPSEVSFGLAAALSQRGAVVEEVILYENVPPQSRAIDLTTLDALTFASPSAAENFLALYPSAEERARIFVMRAIAIGPTTQAALQRLGFLSVYVAQSPSSEAMVQALLAEYKTEA